MKKINSISFLALLVFLLSACDFVGGERVRGNGKVVTETRDVRDFNGISVSGAIDLFVTVGAEFAVRVETDENLQELIEVFRDGSILRVRPADHVNPDPSDAVKVYVTAPSLGLLRASGACSILSEGPIAASELVLDMSGASDADLDLDLSSLRIDLSGASTLKLVGRTNKLSVEGSGASHIKAAELTADDVFVNLSGASSMEIHANTKLEADLSGASNVEYTGSPSVKSNTSGASSVRSR
jgi:hypothetical protein